MSSQHQPRISILSVLPAAEETGNSPFCEPLRLPIVARWDGDKGGDRMAPLVPAVVTGTGDPLLVLGSPRPTASERLRAPSRSVSAALRLCSSSWLLAARESILALLRPLPRADVCGRPEAVHALRNCSA